MIKDTTITDVYTDFGALGQLKAQAQQHNPAALRATAQQFEALFLQTMLKSMRDAVQSSSLFGNADLDLYNGLFDQQLALNISKSHSFGLADIIYNQLSTQLDVHAEPWQSADQFIQHILPAAKQAAADLKVPPEAILSVTALETGWGQHIIQYPEGGSSFNLFGIKATSDWQGQQVAASTLEFHDGVMQQKRERFRAYPSAEQSIQDFTRFLRNNPRYSSVIGNGSNAEEFFNGLQQAGYATDPAYAEKLTAVFHSGAMRQALQ